MSRRSSSIRGLIREFLMRSPASCTESATSFLFLLPSLPSPFPVEPRFVEERKIQRKQGLSPPPLPSQPVGPVHHVAPLASRLTSEINQPFPLLLSPCPWVITPRSTSSPTTRSTNQLEGPFFFPSLLPVLFPLSVQGFPPQAASLVLSKHDSVCKR